MGSEYISKAIPTTIKFNSRASVKIKESYYTFEYGEERNIIDFDTINIDKEIEALANHCNSIVDNQIEDVVNMLLRKN